MSFDYKIDVDYRILIPEDTSAPVSVELLSGDYKGIIYNYGKVSAEEKEEEEQASISFEYELVDSKGFENLEEDINFKNHIGNILVSIVMNNIQPEA